MIKVLIVEDSPAIQLFLKNILERDPDIQVVGVGRDGEEAINLVEKLNPDVVTMDVSLPVINGLEATRIIMERHPLPIIIVSGHFNPRNSHDTFNALQAGAVTIVEKPCTTGAESINMIMTRLVQTIKLMSEVKVVRRMTNTFESLVTQKAGTGQKTLSPQNIKIIGIGASAGGPQIIEKILSGIPSSFAIPIVIVQHITSGFIDGYIDWLNTTSRIPVQLAKDGESLHNGVCYVAPDQLHTTVTNEGKIRLLNTPSIYSSKPSISHLFESIAVHYGRSAIGIILSGMGKDGARELKLIKENGGITIAQDPDSALINGLPGEAVKNGSVMYVYSPEQIIDFIGFLKNS